MSNTVKVDVTELDDLEKVMQDASGRILDSLMTDAGALIRAEMSTHAKNMAPVDTGTLRQMIDSNGEGDSARHGDSVEISISSHASYSIPVEYGTGYKGDPAVPHTTKKIWFQRNPDFHDGDIETPEHPRFIARYPHEPIEFMRPGVRMSVPDVKKIISGAISEVFDND